MDWVSKLTDSSGHKRLPTDCADYIFVFIHIFYIFAQVNEYLFTSDFMYCMIFVIVFDIFMPFFFNINNNLRLFCSTHFLICLFNVPAQYLIHSGVEQPGPGPSLTSTWRCFVPAREPIPECFIKSRCIDLKCCSCFFWVCFHRPSSLFLYKNRKTIFCTNNLMNDRMTSEPLPLSGEFQNGVRNYPIHLLVD